MFYSFLGPFGFGISNALSKVTGSALGTQRAIILQNVSVIFILTIVGYLLNLLGAFNGFWFLLSILLGVWGYVGVLFFMKAIVGGKVGVVLPIIDLAVVVSAICSFLFLGQAISFLGLIFMSIILMGAVLMSMNLDNIKFNKNIIWETGALFAIVASIIWGAEYFLRGFIVSEVGAFNTTILIEIGVLICALFHLVITNKEKFTDKFTSRLVCFGGVIGIFASLGSLGVNLSLATVGGPITFAILGARPAVSALVGYFYFKESLNLKQIFSMLLIMVGVVGVALFK